MFLPTPTSLNLSLHTLSLVLPPLPQPLPTYIWATSALFWQLPICWSQPRHLYHGCPVLIHQSPIRKGLGSSNSFWNKESPSSPPATLSDLVPTLNNFSFNSSHLLQVKGVAMGFNCVFLFVGYVEQSFFQTYSGTTPQAFPFHINNCIGAASCTQAELIFPIFAGPQIQLNHFWNVSSFSGSHCLHLKWHIFHWYLLQTHWFLELPQLHLTPSVMQGRPLFFSASLSLLHLFPSWGFSLLDFWKVLQKRWLPLL